MADFPIAYAVYNKMNRSVLQAHQGVFFMYCKLFN